MCHLNVSLTWHSEAGKLLLEKLGSKPLSRSSVVDCRSKLICHFFHLTFNSSCLLAHSGVWSKLKKGNNCWFVIKQDGFLVIFLYLCAENHSKSRLASRTVQWTPTEALPKIKSKYKLLWNITVWLRSQMRASYILACITHVPGGHLSLFCVYWT